MRLKKDTTIKWQFFFFSTINIVAVVLAIAVTSGILFERAITEKAEMFQQREVSLVCSNIELLVNSINDYLLTLSVDSTVQDVMRDYDDIPPGAEERYNIRLKLMRAVYAKTALNSYIDSVVVISQNGTFFDMGAYSRADFDAIIEENQIDMEHMANKPVWYGPMELDNELIGRENVFIVAKPVVDIWSPNTLGYLFVMVRENTLSGFYHNIMDEHAEMYVVNREEEIISSADKTMLRQKLENMNRSDKDYVRTTGQMSKNDWQVIDFVPKEYLVREMDQITFSMVNIGIAAVLAAFLFSYGIASRVTRPIKTLAAAMKQYNFLTEAGKRVEEVHSSAEMNLLTRRFNQLIGRVEELMRQIEKENQQKREYEFRLIQEQIKPHFLYNSLETIISLIGISMNREAMDYTRSLGNFYRISLSGGTDMIPLSEELLLTKNYLYMQGIRYVDKMTYEIEEPTENLDCMIPKLTLQPLVENAIYHGIKPKRKKSLLKIRCIQEKEGICISVYDNGVGMSPEQAGSLLEKGREDSDTSFGIISIHNRLRLVFGKEYGLEIKSREGKFTEVLVHIPCSERGESDDESVPGRR